MKKKICVLIIAATLSVPARSFAWGGKGHQLVAEIAFHFLSDSTKQKVMKYLKKMTIEEAATWMDDMRSNSYYDYMKTWHYVDTDTGATSYKPSDPYNALSILNAAIQELENKDKNKVSFKNINNDLLLVFHLVGDLTQPLHTGYASDKGGNSVSVTYLSKGNTTNLHSVWDNNIIDSKDITLDSCLQLYNNYTPAQVDQIKKIDLIGWFNQSRSYLDEIYDFKDGFIDQGYVDRNTAVVEQQLLFGGLHLASILEQVFK